MHIQRKTIAMGLVAILGLALLAFLTWRLVTGWTPSRQEYPVQGVSLSAANGAVDWHILKATGVDFAYVRATDGVGRRDRRFAENLAGAERVGLRHGAVHHYDLCRSAADQATLFITTVPRAADVLPNVVELDFHGKCKARPGREIILSEISTFLNQIESHSGKPAILKLAPDFEAQYQLAEAVDRTIWLERDYLLPDYAARPWVMWTASHQHRIRGLSGPVDWVVVRP